MADQAVEDNEDKDDAIYKLSQQIEEFINEFNPLADKADLFTDLLNHALGSVDWYEIAENWIDEKWTDKETSEDE